MLTVRHKVGTEIRYYAATEFHISSKCARVQLLPPKAGETAVVTFNTGDLEVLSVAGTVDRYRFDAEEKAWKSR